MYNFFLNYLMQESPEKCMSKYGFYIRRFINPVLRSMMGIAAKSKCKFCMVRTEELPKDRPLIFAATHGFRDDLIYSLKAVECHAYFLFGNLNHFFYTIDGIALWINGVILVDRFNKKSRNASMLKMEHYLNYGGNLIIFPEATWNRSPNLLVLNLFPGACRLAKRKNALIVPVITSYDEKKKIVYGIVDKPIDIKGMDEREAQIKLRDAMATAKWELMEKQGIEKREHLLGSRTSEQYWDEYLNFLVSGIKYYDYAEEEAAVYVEGRDA